MTLFFNHFSLSLSPIKLLEEMLCMLVMELGFRFEEMKIETIKTQRMEKDESRSVLVSDQDLPVPFLHVLGTKPVPFETKEFQIQTRSVLVVDVVQVVELKQDGDEEERRKPSAITNITQNPMMTILIFSHKLIWGDKFSWIREVL